MSMFSTDRGRWIVALGLTINTAAQAFLFATLPTVGRGIGLHEGETGAILGLGALLGMLLAPAWGFASERFGRRPVLLATMIGMVVSPLIFFVVLGPLPALLPGIAILVMLLATRSIQAGFGAGLIPTAQAYFADITTAGKRGAGMGMMSAAISCGSVAGAALVWIVAGFGTVPGFIVLSVLGGLTWCLALLQLPEPPPKPAVSPDASKIQFGRVWPFFLITMLGMAAYGMMQPIVGLRLMDQFGLPQADAIGRAGAVLTGTALAMMLAQFVVAVRLAWPPQRMLLVGSICGLVGLLAVGFAADFTMLLGAMMLVGASIGMILPGNLAAMSLVTGAKAQGKVAGLNATAMGLGLVLGPMSGPALYRVAPGVPGWIAASLLAVLVVLVLVKGRQGGIPASEPVAVAVPAE